MNEDERVMQYLDARWSVMQERRHEKKNLITQLCGAYSGELAAALAYKGHAVSVWSAIEKGEIKKIEEDELHHRARLREMICEMGETIDYRLERKMRLIGTIIATCCVIGKFIPCGWFLSMYFAGRLETNNVAEYEHAARYAWRSLNRHLVPELLKFAETEWDHEEYFHEKIKPHALYHHTRRWISPPPRECIRESFWQFVKENKKHHSNA